MVDYIESRSKTFRFGQAGDFIKGTLVGVSRTTTPDKWGHLSHIYKVKAEEGTFLDSKKNEKTGKYVQDAAPTICTAGTEYSLFINDTKGVVIGAMKDVKNGQKFMIKFIESKPSSKGNDAKIIKVYPGVNKDGSPAMDETYVETDLDVAYPDSEGAEA